MAGNSTVTKGEKNKEEQKREKQFYLFLVAFGGHKSTMEKLKEYFRYRSGTGISHFFYLEYFLHEPLKIKTIFVNEHSSVFCPFLERMIKEQPFLLDWKKLEEVLSSSEQEGIEQFKQIKTDLLPRTRQLEKTYLNDPLEIKTNTKRLPFGENIFKKWRSKLGEVRNLNITKTYSLQNLTLDLENIISANDIDDADKKALLKERAVLIYPWAKSGALIDERTIHIVGVPIASNKLFYGYILVGFFYMDTDGANNIKCNQLLTELQSKMENQASEFYLPALVLCHHSVYEKYYLKKEEEQFSIEKDLPFLYDELSESSNALERNIHKLWKMRKTNEKEFEDIAFRKAHFIFKGCFWGSPTSIKRIEEALTWDMNFCNDKKPDQKPKLKTFLIFGGPGSGKDTLSKMIGLFSSGHTLSVPYIVNMAALKPDWIAPPSLAGMHLQLGSPDKKFEFTSKQYVLDGIFKKVLDKASKKPNEDTDKWPVLIFDELNSLDIDTQGTLLRIIENAEIVPIGGIDKAVDTETAEKLLVVAVVNELPHQLTMEDTIKSFSRDKKLWGSLLGTALYESFRGVRRLRDDLYYRFRRGGYISLPDLDDRREDIPIIFFASLPDDLTDDIVGNSHTVHIGKRNNEKGNNNEKKIFVEYDVWDLLTHETIQWKGNIRQLQAVAHNIAREVRKEEIKGGKKRDIDVPLVKGVLEKMQLMKKYAFEDDLTIDS